MTAEPILSRFLNDIVTGTFDTRREFKSRFQDVFLQIVTEETSAAFNVIIDTTVGIKSGARFGRYIRERSSLFDSPVSNTWIGD